MAQAVLAGVFAVAGVAKLADHEGARRAIAGFGLPVGIAGALAPLLACCELGVALAILFPASARAGAVAALVLLLGFSAAVALGVGRGRSPDCHCFGRLRSAPLGWSTVARNGLLASTAGFVVAGGRLPALFGGLAVVAAALWLGPGLSRSWRLRHGAAAAGFALRDEAGATWTLDALLAKRRPLVLAFTHPGCGACSALLPALAGWQERLDGRVTVAIVSAGQRPNSLVAARGYGLRMVLVDEDQAVSAAYGITATPSAVLIDGDHRIAGGPALGGEEIASLVERAFQGREDPRFARRGLLGRAATAVASVTVLPAVLSACGNGNGEDSASPPKELVIDGASLCDQRYALCTGAPCERSKSNPKIVNCKCVVRTGYSVGFKSCSERAPAGDRLHSNFSTQAVTSRTRVLSCPSGTTWGNCLDVACRVDPQDPKKALCHCKLVETGKTLTFGGDCDTKTCETVIWSAATPNLPGSSQLEKGMKRIGQPITLPKPCPNSKQS